MGSHSLTYEVSYKKIEFESNQDFIYKYKFTKLWGIEEYVKRHHVDVSAKSRL